MLTISVEQIAELARCQRNNETRQLIARLRAECPASVSLFADEVLWRRVSAFQMAADVLEINESDHVFRLLRLGLLPDDVWSAQGAFMLVWQVLVDTSVSADDRLNFIEINFGACGG